MSQKAKQIIAQNIAQHHAGNHEEAKRLDLSSCGLTDLKAIPELLKMDWVEELWLAGNQITDLAPLAKLNQLTTLGLQNNQITDLAPLANLTQLTNLELYNNQITNLAPLANLTQLTTLWLLGNKITDLAPLAKLNQLTDLRLEVNQITDLAPLANLTQLTKLWLQNNQITDLAPLAKLTQLKQLLLENNQITDLAPLANLTQLTKLGLGGNQITDLDPLQNLTQLAVLALDNNQITDLAPLANLTQLTTLGLRGNQITDLAPLRPLLERTENPLKLSTEQKKHLLLYEENTIYIHNNSLAHPPTEVVMQGTEAVLRYFERLQTEATTFLREAKIIIVGEARVGKTSLLTKIINANKPLPTEEHSTRGIDVTDYNFMHNSNEYLVHIWDFGGQQIYRSTHQLFLSNRSLYLLIDNSSRDDTKLPYWLQKIERLAGNDTPTLLVQNQLKDRQKAVDKKGLWAEFEQLHAYKQPFQFNFKCATSTDKKNLEYLKITITEQIAKMPIVAIEVPQTWKTVREELSKLEKQKALISRADLWSLCKKNNIQKPDDLNDLSQLFHDLGVFLHFKDDPVLKHLVILKKEWATDAIYAVLDDRGVAAKKGRFCKTEVARIWQATDEEAKHANTTEHTSLYAHNTDELLALMCKFELCYARHDQPNEYVIPQLFPNDHPDYKPFTNNYIQLRYEYGSFMPEGILHRLIVRMHRFVTNIDEAWVRGCIFYNNEEGSRAEVLEPYNTNSITIKAEGKNAKNLLNNIVYELDNINKSYGKNGLEPQKLVPCNCVSCKQLIAENKAPTFYKYSDLMKRKEKGKKTVECEYFEYGDVEIKNLIEEVIILNYAADKPLNEEVKPLKVFISYSKQDDKYKTELEKHLDILKRSNLISTWSDRQLTPGEEWDKQIQSELLKADIILLLVSSDFLATDYVWDIEIKKALERHHRGDARVIPIIVRPCDWESAPFGKLTALPNKGKPVIKYEIQDEAWNEITKKLQGLIKNPKIDEQ